VRSARVLEEAGGGFREPGFSEERRLEPQITIGLLTDSSGFLLMASAFEGNKAETTTIVQAFQGRAPAGGCDRGGGWGDGPGGQPQGDRGRRPVVHLRGAHP
jgi:hypothetical protein